ncbi:hypothetical protein MD484_g2589, partial [Candolleomyces efflorescens]
MAAYASGLSALEGSGGGHAMDGALNIADAGPRPPSSGPLFFGMASEQPASQHNIPSSSSHPRILLPPLPPSHHPLPDLFFNGPPPSAATTLVMNVDRPLNVTDALGYLDAVKNQFQQKPDVYNQFLDIMKDFKSQAIDTPGVIQRVSRLFHGNPALIQGFNTFLPQGYRIDISPDHDHTITVTTPTGTTTQSTGTNIVLSRTPRDMPPLAGPGLVYPSGPPILGGPARALTPHGYVHSHDPATFSPGFQQATTAASFLGNLNKSHGAGGPALDAGPPSEFNHAIQYLNKIKARYSDDQNTYKQFLDILQTYQREGKHSQDNQVYLQVQMLFKDAPDLIVEFKNFLPEAVNGGSQQQDAAQMMVNQIWAQQQQQAPPSPQPTKKVAPAKRKKRTDKEPTPVPAPKVAPSRQTKKMKHHHLPDTGSPSFGSPHIPPRSPPPQSHMYQPTTQQPPAHTAPADKLMFFDRAKRALESKEMYEEFLKFLSLFSRDIIDSRALVEGAKVFLGDESLLAEFKELVRWDHQMENPLDYGPPGSIRMQAPDACAPQPVDDGEGPSYRRLPESEIRLACSGRDELCRSVLNDDWVSHPTWASEEAGFVAHKKNSFEEALHKSEEERHEYHVHLEALTRTIALLEPLNARIEEMAPEERATFRLKPDFGGSSKSLYHRTIKRIYGRDNSAEIILAMQEGPSVAVPVVLARLKHKDEDWRRAMREYSRTWREVDSKNFYKSLDHQGISFKANDKKNITAKCFVQDIETIQEQQIKDWEDENGGKSVTAKSFAKRSIGHQLEYSFADTGVLLDSLKLVYSFLDRSQVQYSPQERRTVEKFLRSFIPRLCNISEAEFNAACAPLDGGPSVHGGAGATVEEESHDGQGTGDVSRNGRRSNGSSTAQANGHSNGVPASDLRKKLLKTAQEKASRKDAAATTGGATTAGSNTRGSNSGIGSRAATPSPVAESTSRFAQVDEDGRVIPDLWIKEAPVPSGSADAGGGHDGAETADPVKPFFTNTTFYTLLRLIQLLYSRLLMCKEIGADLAAKKHAPLLANETALELGLVDPSGPSVVLQQSMEALGERPANEPTPNVVYMYLLNACEKMFDNEMDLATFEEHTRWFFGTKAYHLFTLDKLIAALIKQVQIVLSDHKCQELWPLFQLVQGSEHVTKQDVVRYRRSAEKHIADNDHLYRIQWDREKKSIRVSLTSQDDATIETDGSSRRRWREYVNTYVMTHPTEWVPPAKARVSPVFLRRCAQGNEEGSTASTILRDDQTRIRISLPTYKLVYEGGCEEVLARRWSGEEGSMLRERARAWNEERRRSRWLSP